MRNTKIALAVLALVASTAAMAEGVTVYGNMDAGFMSSSSALGAVNLNNLTPNATTKRSNSSVVSGLLSPNYLGFKASEDLDGGLKADIHLQTAFGGTGVGDGGSGSLAFTQSDLGLAGDFGSVRIGKTVDPMWANGVAVFDAAGGANIGSAVTPVIDLGISNIFNDNAITYHSPDIGGFSAHGQYRAASKPGADNPRGYGDGYAATALYVNGPVSVGGGVSENKYSVTSAVSAALAALNTTLLGNVSLNNLLAVDTKVKGSFVGAGYDMGVAKINAVYLTSEFTEINGGNALLGATDKPKTSTWGINGSLPLGSVKLIAGYYNATGKDTGEEFLDSRMYHLGAIYSLSKRTSLFSNYQNVNNSNKTNHIPLIGLNTGSSFRTATSGSASAFTVGVRHEF
jgi:predicted porin